MMTEISYWFLIMELRGILHCSQISNGEENDLNIRVYGETGGLEWHQMEPNTLIVKSNSDQKIRSYWCRQSL